MALKKKFLLCLSFFYIGALVLYVNKIDLGCLKENFTSSSPSLYLIILTFLFINYGILSLRLMLSYHMFGYKISFKESFRIFYASQIGGLFIIPLIGNVIGQILASRNKLIPHNVVLFIAFFERLVIFSAGLVVCAISFSSLYENYFLTFFENNHNLIQICFLFLISVVYLFFFLLSKYERQTIKEIINLKNVFYISTIFVLSIFTWISMAAAYGLTLYKLVAGSEIRALFQSGTIVSFVSSLPISINGWGIREIAAIEIFKLQGIPKDKSLFVAISIGLLSILSLLIIAGVTKIVNYVKPRKHYKNDISNQHSIEVQYQEETGSRLKSDRLIIGTISYLTSILIFLNIYVTFQDYHLNISPGDVLGMFGLILLGLNFYTKNLKFEFIIPQFKYFVLLTSVAFLISSTVSFYNFGFTNWLLVNKFLGWYILIGYTAMGMFFSHYFGTRGIYKLIDLMIFVLSSIIVGKVVLQHLGFYDIISSFEKNFSGFSQNRNAFGCQIICIISLFLIKNNHNFKSNEGWKLLLPVSILCYGSFITFSRTTQIASLIILSFIIIFKVIDLKTFMKIFLITFSIWLFNIIVINMVNLNFIAMINTNFSMPTLLFDQFSTINNLNIIFGKYSYISSDHERWYSIKEGIRQWSMHPFFGMGLSGFSSQQILDHHRYLVIHNSFVWLLTEFGLFGFSVFAYYGILISKYYYNLFKQKFQFSQMLHFEQNVFLFLVLIFILFSIPHDVMYQRMFWFLGGLIITKRSINLKVSEKKKSFI